MANIGGNISAVFQKKTTGKNDLGVGVEKWENVYTVPGWLGLQSGDSKYSYYAKIEESSHVFICDYHSGLYALTMPDEDGKTPILRSIIKGMVYDVLLIDNPDEMDEQLEIYLRKVGAWNGK